jgi:hypothetical protein
LRWSVRISARAGNRPGVLAWVGAVATICQIVYYVPHGLTIEDFTGSVLDLNQTKAALPKGSGPIGVLVFRMS